MRRWEDQRTSGEIVDQGTGREIEDQKRTGGNRKDEKKQAER